MSLPNFICLGASKSGTTTLCNILRQHSDIFIPTFKEPHFFDIPENYKNGVKWYENNYFKNANNKIIADFTPSYFFEKEAPKRISESLGTDIKFIVLLRNPVDRAYSHYLHSRRDEHENLTFEEALKAESARLERYQKEKDYLSLLRNSYLHQGLYGDMIERYLKYFPLKNFLFIHFEEEFLKERDRIIYKILDFLGVDKDIELKTDLRSNPASKARFVFLKKIMNKYGWWRSLLKFLVPSIQLRQIIRSKIQRANIVEFKSDKLSNTLRISLYNLYFKENISRFEDKINKKLNW